MSRFFPTIQGSQQNCWNRGELTWLVCSIVLCWHYWRFLRNLVTVSQLISLMKPGMHQTQNVHKSARHVADWVTILRHVHLESPYLYVALYGKPKHVQEFPLEALRERWFTTPTSGCLVRLRTGLPEHLSQLYYGCLEGKTHGTPLFQEKIRVGPRMSQAVGIGLKSRARSPWNEEFHI